MQPIRAGAWGSGLCAAPCVHTAAAWAECAGDPVRLPAFSAAHFWVSSAAPPALRGRALKSRVRGHGAAYVEHSSGPSRYLSDSGQHRRSYLSFRCARAAWAVPRASGAPARRGDARCARVISRAEEVLYHPGIDPEPRCPWEDLEPPTPHACCEPRWPVALGRVLTGAA